MMNTVIGGGHKYPLDWRPKFVNHLGMGPETIDRGNCTSTGDYKRVKPE